MGNDANFKSQGYANEPMDPKRSIRSHHSQSKPDKRYSRKASYDNMRARVAAVPLQDGY